jgi:ribosome-binding protein aMBF1 (putative translation factor)
MEELITRYCGHVGMKPDGHMPTEPLDSEKQTSRKTSPREEFAREGRPWHGGPSPYEEQHPEIAARVLELWAGGRRKGGMSRDAVAEQMQAEGIPMTAATVDKITTRYKRKRDI